MSKILLINGSPKEKGCTFTALNELAMTVEKHNVGTELVHIGNKPVAGCIACKKCVTTGKCIINDKVNEIIEKLDSYDGIVVGSPVYFGGPNGQLLSFLDRLFYISSNRMLGKLGASIVSCRRGGATAAFDRLNKYFTISSMVVVGSQYWNQVHGNSPEEVRRDEEGLQTIRTLGQNMVWLLQSIEAGRKSGVEFPRYEKRLRTDFIRQ
jgi:multimeric flavodoxin WrbA